jgi:predicted ATPase
MDDPGHRAAYVAATGADMHVVMLGHMAMNLTCLGHIDQGVAVASRGLSEVRRSGHALSVVFISVFAAQAALWSGSLEDARQRAEEAVALSTEHDFPLWLGYGLTLYGSSLTELGEPQAGLDALQKGLATYKPTGAVLFNPIAFTALAETHRKLGQPTEAFNCLAEAEQVIERAEGSCIEAEYHRVRGDVLVEYGDPRRAGESYNKALSVARRQSAKLFELRAATSLARLSRDQGKWDEARELLAPVYGWFTEGFDTRDLKEAKALLDKLTM